MHPTADTNLVNFLQRCGAADDARRYAALLLLPTNRGVSVSKYKCICLLIIITLHSGCIRFVTPASGVVAEPEKARSFGDGFMADVVGDRREALYARMESEFRRITSRERFGQLLDDLYAQFGRPLKYEYFGEEVGAKLLYDGTTKGTRKIFYRAETTKGVHTLSVTVVPDGDHMAATDFLFSVELP
jgi:hypothetical protein